MKHSYQLIKLRTNTVQDLKRLKTDMGIAGLDELVNIMIRVTNEHRLVLGCKGWDRKGEGSDTCCDTASAF
jgi:hypothetical protein